MVQYYLQLHAVELNKPPTVYAAATLFADILYKNKERLLAGIIVGGWDKLKGGQVYTIPLGGALVEQAYAIGGSGSTYIYSWCDANFKPNMSRQECEAFVQKGLAHAMARDGSSGGLIRTATIEEDRVTRNVIPGDKLPFDATKMI